MVSVFWYHSPFVLSILIAQFKQLTRWYIIQLKRVIGEQLSGVRRFLKERIHCVAFNCFISYRNLEHGIAFLKCRLHLLEQNQYKVIILSYQHSFPLLCFGNNLVICEKLSSGKACCLDSLKTLHFMCCWPSKDQNGEVCPSVPYSYQIS